jgi:hypothetical protein
MWQIEFIGWNQGGTEGYSTGDYDPRGAIGRAFGTREEAEAALASVLGPDTHGVAPVLEIVEA